MKSLFTIFILTLLLISQINAQNAGWIPHGGPGQVGDIKINPHNFDEIIYATSKSGIMKSTDRGYSWFFAGNGLLISELYYSYNIGICAYDPVDPSIMYAGTGYDETSGGNGLFKSSNSGNSWFAINEGLQKSSAIRSLEINPLNSNVMYLSLVGQNWRRIYKTCNGGKKWNELLRLENEGDGVIYLDKEDTSNVTIVTSYGYVYNSVNSGEDWSLLAKSAENYYGIRKMVKNKSGNCFYLLGLRKGAYKFSLEDSSFASINKIPLHENSLFGDIEYDAEKNILYAACDAGLYITSDEGENWERICDYPTNSIDLCGEYMTIGTAYGVYISYDGGSEWLSCNTNAGCAYVYTISISNQNPEDIFISTDCGAFRTADNGKKWEHIDQLPFGFLDQIAVDPRNDSLIYSCYGGFFNNPNMIMKSTNKGSSWTNITPKSDIYNTFPITKMAIHPDSSNVLFICAPGIVWKSTDGGISWKQLLAIATPKKEEIADIIVSKSNPQVIYIAVVSNEAGYAGIFVTKNGGKTWERKEVSGQGIGNVMSLAVDPTDPAKVFAGTEIYGLYKSTDAGDSWTHVVDNVPTNWGSDAAWDVIIDENNPSNIYYTLTGYNPIEARGVYKSSDGGESWSHLPMNGLYNNLVSSLAIDKNGNLYAGALGGGIFKYSSSISIDPIIEQSYNYALSQNYPNPFNPSTVISYDIPEASRVTLKVYDILGREVADLVNEFKEAGRYNVKFDASHLSTGIYIYQLRANDYVSVKKMSFVK